MKKFNQLAKKKLLKIFLSSIRTKVAIKFLKKTFFRSKIGLALKGVNIFFSTDNHFHGSQRTQ